MWSVFMMFGLMESITGNNEIMTSSNIYSHQRMVSDEAENDIILLPSGPTNNSNQCVLTLGENNVDLFRHLVFYNDFEFVYLKLNPQEGVVIKGNGSTVGANIWTWTFYNDKHGGMKYLRWPIEFGIWSVGLLNNHVFTKPMEMDLHRVSGNCSNLMVGKSKDDLIIGTALLNLTMTMKAIKRNKYDATLLCYKKRKWTESNFLYNLCKNIVCPIEALKYHCCNTYFNITYQKRVLQCNHINFYYDTVSWILPVLVSVILFAVCPIFLLKAVHKFSRHSNSEFYHQMERTKRHATLVDDNNRSVVSEFVFQDGEHHVTFFMALWWPFDLCIRYIISNSHPSLFSIWKRLFRLCIPLLSLSFIGVQVCLDYIYLYEFVLSSLRKGAPLGFRSMISGFEESRKNFLPWLGGPYIAVGVYLLITVILLVVPSSVSELLGLGLPLSSCHEDTFPICVKNTTIERLGSVRFRRRKGFDKIQKVLEGQFFMLLNVKHWKRIFCVQKGRWNAYFSIPGLQIFFPFYFIFCIIETLVCFLFFGCPILSFGFIITRAYYRQLWNQKKGNSCPVSVLFVMLTFILIISVVYFLCVFCTIVMDACVFIARVLTFTYSGIIAYPKESYGYIIFAVTVVYYVGQCIHEFSLKYQSLLKDTIAVCERMQRANDSTQLVARKDGLKGIRIELFDMVIEEHCPKRKQVLICFAKVFVIIVAFCLALNCLQLTNGFRKLQSVTHVGTVLFLCALPQLTKSICKKCSDRFQRKKLRIEIVRTVGEYSGYFNTTDTSVIDLVEDE
ncbi:hypothetical protein ACF0H5_021447 [Mactra antiquata]